MSAVATYVFLHLKTKSLPEGENSVMKITHIHLIAVERSNFVQSATGQLPSNKQELELNYKRDYYYDSYSENSEDEFDEDSCHSINMFLARQMKPVCLVAHTGYRYHYPILQEQFDKFEVSLPNDILCVDALYGMYDTLKAINSGVKFENQSGAMENSEDEEDSLKKEKSKIIPAMKLADALRDRYFPGRFEVSHRVVDLFRREFNTDGFDEDMKCVLVAKLAMKLGDRFLDWIDSNTIAFSEQFVMPED